MRALHGFWAPAAPVLIAAASVAAMAETPITDADREHWSFRAPVRPAVPQVNARDGSQLGALDRFVLARLQAEGLGFAPEADRRTLMRRLSFDLTGLPPTPDEVNAFLGDRSADAYEKLVDRLLDSTAYGERWAQHWLDIARFAESDGFEHDKIRKEAWRYRDWVIAALNEDMPYDRFVQMQLAADEIAPDDPKAQHATGFLMAGPDMPDINLADERRHNFLNAMTSTVGQTFYALTLGCAQCHDHKTDPVSTDDFYRLRAIFANTVVRPEKNKQLGPTVAEADAAPPESFVMVRGDFARAGNKVEPAFLRVLNPAGATIGEPDEGVGSSMRRRAFAQWLTRPDHPLTARVIVNRLWMHHFGRGIVASAGDFGHTGDSPSHPQLLDWLATELPARGWSLKAMHRLMVTSRTYRQTSKGSGANWTAATERDPSNLLLSRMSRRRLEGEAIRDTFLAVSGQLNRKAGGPGVRPPLPSEITSTMLNKQWEVTADESEHRRRSIYIFARRNLRYPLFEVFDRPDSNLSCSRRNRSTTAPQSLTLLNSEFSASAAQALATRIAGEVGTAEQHIERAHELLFSRPPTARERELGLSFLNAGANGGAAKSSGRLHLYCLALLNASEAIYID